jgi:ribosomal-protein-alanine N-acetyltransferase
LNSNDEILKNNLLSVQIESPRLLLVPITEDYAEEIFKYFDDEITLYMVPKPAEKIEETYQFIHSSIEGLNNGSNLQLVILIKSTNEFIGCAGLHRINTKTPELGIWTKKDSHGNAYGLEAITAMICWSKKNLEIKEIIQAEKFPS